MSTTSRLLALLLALLLVACNPLSTVQRPTPAPIAPTGAPIPSPRPAATVAPRPTAVPPVTALPAPPAPPRALVLWAIAEGQELDALRRLIADLRRPIGVDVVIVGKSADGLLADMRADAIADLPLPDLVWGTQDELAPLQADGLLQPAGDALDDGAFLPAVVVGATIEGRRWGTPVAAQGYLLLLYNRRLADRAPHTSDELIARSRQLTGGKQYGLVAGWAEPRWFSAWLEGVGGAAISPDGTPTLDTPQTVAALDLLRELRVAGPPPPATYAEGVRLFYRGAAAFAIDGDWSLERYRAYSETLDLGIAPLPVVPASGRPAVSPMGGVYLMYTRALDGPRRAHARALGGALVRQEAQARIARDLHRLPALRSALLDAAVIGDAGLAAAATYAERAPGLPPLAALRCAWAAIRAELPPVLLGALAQADAARNMQASATICIQ